MEEKERKSKYCFRVINVKNWMVKQIMATKSLEYLETNQLKYIFMHTLL